MKLEDTRGAHDDASGKAGDISRQLALAALAVVWIFKTNQPTGIISVPQALILPSAMAIASLAFDLLQYVYATIAWAQFNRYMEKKTKLNEEKIFNAPRWINWPTNVFFYLKIVTMIVCYVFLLNYLLRAIAH
jgi:hypothetical protein